MQTICDALIQFVSDSHILCSWAAPSEIMFTYPHGCVITIIEKLGSDFNIYTVQNMMI